MNEEKITNGITWFINKIGFIFVISGLIYGIKSQINMFEEYGFWMIVMLITLFEILLKRFGVSK